MIVVAPDPVPAYAVPRRECVELAPEIVVLDGLPVRSLPAVALPAVDPRLDAVLHVLRVGVQIHFATAFERLERADDRGELHPVVRGGVLAAKELFLVFAPLQKCAPASR